MASDSDSEVNSTNPKHNLEDSVIHAMDSSENTRNIFVFYRDNLIDLKPKPSIKTVQLVGA